MISEVYLNAVYTSIIESAGLFAGLNSFALPNLSRSLPLKTLQRRVQDYSLIAIDGCNTSM